ncbi:protein phosphatase 2A regulatory B subunit family protein [Striga asiatica]|uniref:Protein phosphatase 2A regulatory B subunit family protein n=1 Tax=Striga asiatica TaxID=4170 RepID=A0A5A7NWX3_STRAF|nr:protein phosphatase 2A regulatory B subunit family protein [Striga asiatica]
MSQNGYGGLEQTKRRPGPVVQQPRPHGMKAPSPAEMNPSRMHQWKYSQRLQRKNQTNWAFAEPGMQAIFLGLGPKSCGTGVFIPQTQVTNRPFNKRPAFSPVLLPARVVQTLKLNVHELGKHTKPQLADQCKNIAKKDDKKQEKDKKKENGIYISPDIFLPEEWTY